MAKQENTAVKQLWGLGIGFGVVSILFGILALFWPGLTVALLLAMFGVFLLVWGIVGLIASLASTGSDKFWWLELIFSLLAVGLAVYVLRNPEVTAAIFVLYIGLTFLVRGVIDLVEGIFDKGRQGDGRILAIILGILGVAAGLITLAHPVSAGIAVVWVIGLYAVLYGTIIVAFSIKAQNAVK